MRSPILIGLAHAVGVVLYVALVASAMMGAEKWVQRVGGVMVPVAFLLLFVISAAITGTLVLGRPLMAYLDGRKADAVQIFLATVGWLVVMLVIVFVVLVVR